MSKWDSELTEEKLQDQIKAAKDRFKEQKIKLKEVYYEDECLHFIISDEMKDIERLLSFHKTKFRCLIGISDEDISRVSFLGDRAIQWKDLNIQIGLDKLLDGIQLKEEWLESIR